MRVRELRLWAEPFDPTEPVVTPEALATAPLARVEAIANAPELHAQYAYGPRRTRIVVPDYVPYPDEFWERIAHRYTSYVVHGRRSPAALIAEDAGGVPVPTVRGWIAHCRQIGMLRKGKQGRAG